MSYTKADWVVAKPNETVVQLDTGDYVAVSCEREHIGGSMRFYANARVIDEQGNTIANAMGSPLKSALSYSVDIPVVEAQGADVIARDCLLAVLGEQVARWDAQWLASASIRSHLIAAPSVGAVDAGELL